MDGHAIERIAQAFVTARTEGKALPDYPGERPRTLAEAYEVQDHALRLWDRPVGGWKVGKIPPPVDGELGANRLIGPIMADTIYEQVGSPIAMPTLTAPLTVLTAQLTTLATSLTTLTALLTMLTALRTTLTALLKAPTHGPWDYQAAVVMRRL